MHTRRTGKSVCAHDKSLLMRRTLFPCSKPKPMRTLASMNTCLFKFWQKKRATRHCSPLHVTLTWAKLKGNAGRKHNSNTTMTILKARLDAEFQAGMSWHCSIKGFMRASSEKAMEFHPVNMENDNDDDCNEDSDSVDDGSESEDESDDEEVEVVGL